MPPQFVTLDFIRIPQVHTLPINPQRKKWRKKDDVSQCELPRLSLRESSLPSCYPTSAMRKQVLASPAGVFTIGHSTRSLPTFVEMLKAHGVKRLVDVRTVPRSRHNRQFNKEFLPESLAAEEITCVHMPGLSGLRHARLDSINTDWRNESFRGYADYMQTPQFEENLEKLLRLAGRWDAAIMCAEAVPWRCHRSLIADALTARGVQVEHISSAKRRCLHTLTPWARIDGVYVTYPPECLPLNLESDR